MEKRKLSFWEIWNMSFGFLGIQMGFAYMGSMVMPPFLGVIASKTSIAIFPYFLLCYMIIMLIGSERINNFIKNTQQQY